LEILKIWEFWELFPNLSLSRKTQVEQSKGQGSRWSLPCTPASIKKRRLQRIGDPSTLGIVTNIWEFPKKCQKIRIFVQLPVIPETGLD
jgi:hypothetical protein